MANESDLKTLNNQPRSYTNGACKNELVYLSPDTMVMNTDFINADSNGF